MTLELEKWTMIEIVETDKLIIDYETDTLTYRCPMKGLLKIKMHDYKTITIYAENNYKRPIFIHD